MTSTSSKGSVSTAQTLRGPEAATVSDIPLLNAVFTEAFTERYRKDGLVGVRVPPLSPAIWRYAIEDAGEGALCWRAANGRIVAFNMVHQSGTEGWMGPLCIEPGLQGVGIGKVMVQTGMQWLKQRGATVIGLETMPRTMENIGFYSSLGFIPSYLTITLTLGATTASDLPAGGLLSRLSSQEKVVAVDGCRTLTGRVMPGYDFTREIVLTDQLSLGDTLLLGSTSSPIGFALCHSTPLVEGRSREELRVLKLVLEKHSHLPAMVGMLTSHARRVGTSRVAIRLQGDYAEAYRILIALGARVRWTDLRMSTYGWRELMPAEGIVLSNWEI